MTFSSSAAFASLVLGVGLLIAPVGASATTITTQIQIDDEGNNNFFANYLVNGVEILPNTSCGNLGNCSLSEGFYVAPSNAVNETVNFNVLAADGITIVDFGTASFFFQQNGSLQDFQISMNATVDFSPFTAADDPVSFIRTGDFQTVASISGIPDTTDGNPNDVLLQFRSEIPDPVPEPSTIALLGSGLLGLVAFGWRRNVRT
jgi:hypothetical protein